MCLIGALVGLAFFIGFVLLVKYLLPKNEELNGRVPRMENKPKPPKRIL